MFNLSQFPIGLPSRLLTSPRSYLAATRWFSDSLRVQRKGKSKSQKGINLASPIHQAKELTHKKLRLSEHTGPRSPSVKSSPVRAHVSTLQTPTRFNLSLGISPSWGGQAMSSNIDPAISLPSLSAIGKQNDQEPGGSLDKAMGPKNSSYEQQLRTELICSNKPHISYYAQLLRINSIGPKRAAEIWMTAASGKDLSSTLCSWDKRARARIPLNAITGLRDSTREYHTSLSGDRTKDRTVFLLARGVNGIGLKTAEKLVYGLNLKTPKEVTGYFIRHGKHAMAEQVENLQKFWDSH